MVLLPILAGLQTAQAQGFRVYKSDGTVAQFSLRTDSIVFYDGIGSDVDFGPFTPVNQCIVGTWYKTKSESVTFNEDGTTDYMQGATYEFLPYQGTVIIYNASGSIMQLLRIPKVTKDYVVLSEWGDNKFAVYTREKPVQLVTSITLSETSLSLKPDESKRLTATVYPSDADNPAVTWESSNDGVAEVNSTGRVTANAVGTCTITCLATDGSGVKAECQVTVKSGDTGLLTCPDNNHPHAIDLGLPSGTKWACCNVGATTPEGYGDYFAWGETTTKSVYNPVTYTYCTGVDTDRDGWYDENTSYTNIGSDIADTRYDAATANWGAPWRMPSHDQQMELMNNCSRQWTTQNDVNGTLVTGPNGGQIFLPAAGYRWNGELNYAGSFGYYWSGSLFPYDDSDACYVVFYSDNWGWDDGYRGYGHSVRAVRP